MEDAATLLGRPYSLTAEVINGQKLARNLGFPTLNQRIPEGIAVPRFGVYVSRVRGLGDDRFGITNVGMRPTVKGDLLCAETHIFDFNGDLYGQTLTIELLHFLRAEAPFPSLEALTDQVLRDIEEAKKYSGSY
jgi:riboflavin kinase/FMN adenylyltransferase